MYDKSMNSLLRPRCVPVTGEERTGGGKILSGEVI